MGEAITWVTCAKGRQPELEHGEFLNGVLGHVTHVGAKPGISTGSHDFMKLAGFHGYALEQIAMTVR